MKKTSSSQIEQHTKVLRPQMLPEQIHGLLDIHPVVESYEGNRVVNVCPLEVSPEWSATATVTTSSSERTVAQISLKASCLEDSQVAKTVGFLISFREWSPSVYVLLPGAVYAANRFRVFKTTYSPQAPSGEAGRALQTMVPRLSFEPGPSCLRQMSSDPAFPGIGFFFPASRKGLWILTPAKNAHGLFGYELRENDQRDHATLTIFSPGLLREFEYEICNDSVPSTFLPKLLGPDDTIEIPLLIEAFDCDSPQGLFDRLITLRHAFVPPPARRHDIPFSEVWSILEDKYLRENWVEPQGYFSVGVEPMRSRTHTQNWQMGWVGGMITPHAMLIRGGQRAVDCALRNFDFVFPAGQAPSGYFYPDSDGKKFLSDALKYPQEKRCLIRKCADGLFYMLSTLTAAEQLGLSQRIKPLWLDGLRRCADAFVTTWRTEGEWGHFVNHDTGRIVVPGSASAGIAPAALVLAARRFPERRTEYMSVAAEAAQYFDREFLSKGYTTGGPGDAAQCPDSESLAGLLESYTTLFEETRDPRWLDAARRAATHAASWTVSYDFPFPPESTFGKLGMLTTGTVLANAQNKHSAPGICTHSGLSLLRLYRHTGQDWMMDLLRDIAHTLPQYMSRADRPIPWTMPYNMPDDPSEKTLRPGWMCERVNLTYWGGHELPGEVFYYSCWSEVALLLTIAELPGIYARSDTRKVWSLDHIEAWWDGDTLHAKNTTRWPATFTCLVETAAQASSTPWPAAAQKLTTHTLQPGQSAVLHR